MSPMISNNIRHHNNLIDHLGQNAKQFSWKVWKALTTWSAATSTFLSLHRTIITANTLFLVIVGQLMIQFEQVLNRRFPSFEKTHYILTTGFLGTAIGGLNYLCFRRISPSLSWNSMIGMTVTCTTLYLVFRRSLYVKFSLENNPQHFQERDRQILSMGIATNTPAQSHGGNPNDSSNGAVLSSTPHALEDPSLLERKDSSPIFHSFSELLSFPRTSSAPLPLSTPYHFQPTVQSTQHPTARTESLRKFTPKKQGITAIVPMQTPELNQKDIDLIEKKALEELNELQKRKDFIQQLEQRSTALEQTFYLETSRENRDSSVIDNINAQMQEIGEVLKNLQVDPSKIDEKLNLQLNLLAIIRQTKPIAKSSDAPSAPGTSQAIFRQRLLQTVSPIVNLLSAFKTKSSTIRNLGPELAAIHNAPSFPSQANNELDLDDMLDDLSSSSISLGSVFNDPNFDSVEEDANGNPLYPIQIDDAVYLTTEEGFCYDLDGNHVGQLAEKYFKSLFTKTQASS